MTETRPKGQPPAGSPLEKVRIVLGQSRREGMRDADLDAAADRVMRELERAEPGTVVCLDLGEAAWRASDLARVLSFPLVKIVSGQLSGRYLLVADAEGQNLWDADAALLKESEEHGNALAVVWRPGDGAATLAGRVDPLIRETYTFVAQAPSPVDATARLLAEREGVSVQAASNRLSRTARLGLIHAADRIPADGGGWQHAYVAVV